MTTRNCTLPKAIKDTGPSEFYVEYYDDRFEILESLVERIIAHLKIGTCSGVDIFAEESRDILRALTEGEK